ncbi:hypothetical protein BH10ACI2_BH10ACI2_02820 [soil metagenome]
MKIELVTFLLVVTMIAACGNLPFGDNRGSSNTTLSNSSPKQPETNTAIPESADPKGNADINYLAYAVGTTIVEVPKDWDKAYYTYTTYNLIDESAKSSWESQSGPANTTDQIFVFELAEKTLLNKFSVDTAYISDAERTAKEIKIEVSDVSRSEGFSEVIAATLALKKDGQIFTVAKPVPGRWVRLTLKNNFGSKDKLELAEIRGYGEQLTSTAKLENVSGTYRMSKGIGNLHLKQEGTSVIGCYEYRNGILSGGSEGRVLKATLTEVVNETSKTSEDFSGMFAFLNDGKQIVAFLRNPGETKGYTDQWSGTKISSDVGDCPQFKDLGKSDGAASQLANDLTKDGRAVIYGINFDFNSDKLRDESKAVLNQIVTVLKTNKDWKMTIEGHTDNIGGEAFNKTLSEKRAIAVKEFLTASGIDAARLTAAGLGLIKPLAPNETEAGRAQNRRVELVKN